MTQVSALVKGSELGFQVFQQEVVAAVQVKDPEGPWETGNLGTTLKYLGVIRRMSPPPEAHHCQDPGTQ